MANIYVIKCFRLAAFLSMVVFLFLLSFTTPSLCTIQHCNAGFLSTWKKYLEQYVKWLKKTLFCFPNWSWGELKMWYKNNANLVGRQRHWLNLAQGQAAGYMYLKSKLSKWETQILGSNLFFAACAHQPYLNQAGHSMNQWYDLDGIELCQCNINFGNRGRI